MRSKIAISVFLGACILILLGAVASWHMDKLDVILRLEIQRYARKNLPANIVVGSSRLRLLPLSLTVSEIKILPKRELQKKLKNFEIESITLSPSFLHLVIGKFHLSSIEVVGTRLQVTSTSEKSSPLPVIELEKILRQIPVTHLRLRRVGLNLRYRDAQHSVLLDIDSANGSVTNDINNLIVKVGLDKITLDLDRKSLLKDSHFETHFFLTEKNLVLSDFKLKEKDSFIIASGSTQHSLKKLSIAGGVINVRTQVGSEKIKSVVNVFIPSEDTAELAAVRGALRADWRVRFNGLDSFEIDSKTQLQGLAYEKFTIGDIQANGTFNSRSKTIHMRETIVTNPGINAVIRDFKMHLDHLTFDETDVEVKSFALQKYLEYSLHKKIPADIGAIGQVKCKGQLKEFLVNCAGHMAAKELHVKTDGGKALVDLAKAKAEGQVTINDKEVSYKAQITTEGGSRGASSGVIIYKKGFNISYETPSFKLDEIKHVAELSLEGETKITGSTQGDSDAAVFEINFDGKNVVFENYKLGDVAALMKYKSGVLSFTKLQGSMVSSRYLGELFVDLRRDWLTGKVQFPFIDLAVLRDSIQKELPIPVALSGSGSSVIQLDTPLNVRKLSFKAKTRLYNCKVEEQHIDTADIDLISTAGKISFNNVNLEEKNSALNVKGLIHLDTRQLELSFGSPKVFLDDITYAKAYAPAAKGLFKTEGVVKGDFSTPRVELRFDSDNFAFAGQRLAPIGGRLDLSAAKILVDVNGPGNLTLSYRDLKSSNDILLEGSFKNLDLTPLITSLLDVQRLEDFNLIAESSFNLKINRHNFSDINGYVHLPILRFSVLKAKLANEKDISLFFNDGKVNFSSFNMSGTGGNISFLSQADSVRPIDVRVSGVFSLSFLHLFAPFLETMEGQTSINVRAQSSEKGFHFIGSAFIEEGFIKLPAIPHAVEDLKVDVLFNQDQVLINSFKGRFASGEVLGDGKIGLKGKHDIPLAIKLHFDNVNLNLPAQVNTIGNARLELTGNWLPYTLSGVYNVNDGLITKEFSGGGDSNANPHQVFLPPALRADRDSPIKLDLAIVPAVPLRIKNSMVDGKASGKLTVRGDPESPVLGGGISFIKNSHLMFRDAIFRVRDSNIVLNNTIPPNPTLYIVADSRYKGYDIEMLIQGAANNPKFKLTSQPTLSEQEIISLLALGYTSNATQAGLTGTSRSSLISSNTITNTGGVNSNNNSLQVGTGLFSQNPLGREFKDRFGWDVQFSSKFDSSSSVAVPAVSFGKQFTERLSGVATYQSGKDSRKEAKMRYELNRDFSATMSLQSRAQEEANQVRTSNTSDILGIDLEYRKEFK